MSEAPSPNPAETAETASSVHSASFPPLLRQLGISLAVSTYQAGKVILIRARGDVLNSLYRDFERPMGVAQRDGDLTIGTRYHVWEYHNHSKLVPKLTPPGQYDACYLPHRSHVTGDIAIHEMAWAGQELWIVNTRFSCLCTLETRYNFVPRWRPPFISELTGEDRCHLNGLGVRDGQLRYATCLGQTDSHDGWRVNKINGGCLLEVPSGAVICQGLSMPHSPRWHQGKLWFLESGEGTLSTVDEATGTHQAVARMPGFTRGLDFHGGVAFVGLSQLRGTSEFTGLPITQRLQERTCGVWAIDLATGATLAFLQFSSGVKEIFAVTVLPGVRFPELITDDYSVIGNSFYVPKPT